MRGLRHFTHWIRYLRIYLLEREEVRASLSGRYGHDQNTGEQRPAIPCGGPQGP